MSLLPFIHFSLNADPNRLPTHFNPLNKLLALVLSTTNKENCNLLVYIALRVGIATFDRMGDALIFSVLS